MSNTRISTFVRECQLFAGRSSLPDGIDSHRAHLRQFVSRLPPPAEPLEKLAMTALLFDVAVQWSNEVHEQHHADFMADCAFDPRIHLMRTYHRRCTSPVTAFAEWATGFLDTLERSHPVPPAILVQQIVQAQSGTRLNATMLAREAGCHPARLRALFKRRFGMSVREYQTRCQLARAARLLVQCDLKIDAVAHMAGFPNRKNFYAAFARILDTTPSTLRTWSQRDLENLERRLLPRIRQSERRNARTVACSAGVSR